jgi:hypothetical protein
VSCVSFRLPFRSAESFRLLLGKIEAAAARYLQLLKKLRVRIILDTRRRAHDGSNPVPRREEISVAFTLDSKRKQRFDFMRCLYERTEGSEVGLVYIEEIAEEIRLPQLETEIIALYLADEGLIRVRMQHIISITHLGIDEVETALAQPAKPTEHFPALQTTVPIPPIPIDKPKAASDARTATDPRGASDIRRDSEARPVPARMISPKPVDKLGDELAALELKAICEAIGLDPKEFTGETAEESAPESIHIEERVAHNAASPDVNQPESSASAPIPEFMATDLAEILASLKLRLLKIRLTRDDMAEAQAEFDTALAQLFSPRPKLPIIAAALRTILSILEKAGPAALTRDVEVSLSALRAFLQQLNV